MQLLSKAKAKLLRSLHQKKYRFANGLFLVEGRKMLQEALASGWDVDYVVIRDDVPATLPANFPLEKVFGADARTFSAISELVSPEGVLAVVRFPTEKQFSRLEAASDMPALTGPAFLLEDIQDPGNLGTILRTADWFGFSAVVCSGKTADCFNPKVLRSSMGAIFRVPIIYLQAFPEWVGQVIDKVWLADMAGEAAGVATIASRPFLLLGNEANGVSPGLRALPGAQRLSIPRSGGGESLNVAISGAILAWELRKSIQTK